ncbi:zinc finger protein 3 isoform X13 [Cephus cinctus]|uniref:Zinc finger protein 3 isoform X13 n=1 Tax=Cephus cinctus TaxID=211228 RepID=A0AAJ7VZ08_CEPCN|nr:zinc finger protein 3 isoform X13 [Cephus cinctus]
MAETARSGVNERRAPNDAGSSPAWVKQRTRPRARLASRTGVLHGKMSSLDYLDLCRLCLVKDRVSVPIFEGEGDVRQIFLKIAACLPVKVAREDKLPKKICDDCVYKVELFYQFWNTTANAEKQLLQWLGEVGLEEKQGYVTGVLNPSVMKQEQNSESRLDSNVMQQVSGHQDNMGGMTMIDNMGLGMPIMIPSGNQQQITSVPMDTSGNSVQTVRPVQQAVVAVAGPSAQPNHQEQLAQNQGSASATAGTGTNPTTATPTVVTASISHQDDEEDTTDEDENSDEECDADEGLPVKEESEEDPSNNRTIEPTTFVNVSLACDEAGPSGLQQQKITEMPEMSMPQAADGDPKSGLIDGKKSPNPLEQRNGILLSESSSAPETTGANDQGSPSACGTKSFSVSACAAQSGTSTHVEKDSRAEEDETHRTPRDSTESQQPAYYAIFPGALKDVDSVLYLPQREYDDAHDVYERNEDSKIPVDFSPSHEAQACSDAAGQPLNTDLDGTADRNSDPEKRLKCEECDRVCVNKELLRKHKIVHSKVFRHECQICGKKFKRSTELKIHGRTHSSERNFACELCGSAFKLKSQLVAHARRHTADYRVFCKLCGKGFHNNSDYQSHNKVKHVAKEHACPSCGRSYREASLLRRHQRIHQPDYVPDKRFQCEICGKTFVLRKSLEMHLKSHTGEKRYKCDVCGKGLCTRSSLRDHIKLHTGQKPIVCDVCGRAFTKRSTMMVHRRTHTGERPYRCNVCNNSYTQRTSLVIHQRYHSGRPSKKKKKKKRSQRSS